MNPKSTNKPLMFAGAWIVSFALVGSAFALVCAIAKLLGDAEIYSVDQLPPPPIMPLWVMYGAIVGGGLGIVSYICFGLIAAKPKSSSNKAGG